jgi:hypothetical protein
MTHPPAIVEGWDPVAFLAIYSGLSVLATLAVYLLLLRERRRMVGPPDRAGFGEAVT